MRGIFVGRCAFQLLRTIRAPGFTNELTGQRMLGTAVPSASGSQDRRLKSLQDISELNSVDQADSWDDIPKMKAAWADIVHELTETGSFQILPEAMKWTAKAMNYTIIGGNTRRYFALMHAYKNLVPANQLTEENLRLARMLGWCCEMCVGSFNVFDDILDKAETRRRKLCWYKKDDIGINAVIDFFTIINLPLELIRRHLKGHPCYVEMIEFYNEIMLKAAISTSSDALVSNFGKKLDLDKFTMDLFHRTVLYKSSYSIILPIYFAMCLAGIKDPEVFRQAELILMEIGRFFQVQNDYRDCFGDPNLKTETDISGGKFTWPIAVALQRATPEQRKILDECFGQNDPEKVAKVKQLYKDLGMQTIYATYEEQSYNLVNIYIQQISCGLPHNIFFMVRDNIYGTSAERSQIKSSIK